MYGLSVEEKELFLTKAFSEDVVVTIAVFVVPFGSSKSDVVKLAKEMVAVLNRDLENRANDIAATPENIATSDQPQLRPWQKHIEEYRRFGGCTDKECTVCPPGRMTKDKFVLDDQEEPPELPNASDNCGDPDCCDPVGLEKESENKVAEWATDETGLPVLERAGEIKEFPEPVDFNKVAEMIDASDEGNVVIVGTVSDPGLHTLEEDYDDARANRPSNLRDHD